MPYDSNGNATITRNRAVTGQTVQAAQVNTPFDDVQSMLSQVLLRSGVAPMTGALNMNGFKITNVGEGATDTDAATIGQVKSSVPVGVVISFSGNAAPSGWMLCYGQPISRTLYSALFSVIGTSFGSGDGSTTFNLPDCRGRVDAGKDDMGGSDSARLSIWGSLSKAIGGVFGSQSHVISINEMPPHDHPINDPGHLHSGVQNSLLGQGRGEATPPVAQYSRGTSDANFTGITVLPSGGGQAHNNTQPTIIFNKIIKVQ